jgi:hypothetical protein
VDNQTLNPSRYYDKSSSMFVLPLQSAGKPIEIVLNFDIPSEIYLFGRLSSLGELYVLVLAPIAVTALYLTMKGRRKLRTKGHLKA